MAKRPKKSAKFRAQKIQAAPVNRLTALEKQLAGLERRFKRIEALVIPHIVEDTPQTVAEKATQARKIMGQLAGALVDPE
jgi:hypothetical protein